MKNTKKILAGIMALTMTAGFAACSSGDDQGTINGGNGGGGEAGSLLLLKLLPQRLLQLQ
ncbi:MAG: hypothetical protein K2J73_09505 [Oscillospiraceae bacterium]|nr:hypothetical protein [Oscillospiraceae bacterium]